MALMPMKYKILIPLHNEEVAPRFDLATEVLLVETGADGGIEQEKVLIMPGPSAEGLCQLVITEEVNVVICGGVEEEFYDYLSWKRVRVIDAVIGPCRSVLNRFLQNRLQPGDIIRT